MSLTSRKQTYSVHFKQDTQFTDKECSYIRSESVLEYFINNFDSNARGAAILVNNILEFQLITTEIYFSGNLFILHC